MPLFLYCITGLQDCEKSKHFHSCMQSPWLTRSPSPKMKTYRSCLLPTWSLKVLKETVVCLPVWFQFTSDLVVFWVAYQYSKIPNGFFFFVWQQNILLRGRHMWHFHSPQHTSNHSSDSNRVPEAVEGMIQHLQKSLTSNLPISPQNA